MSLPAADKTPGPPEPRRDVTRRPLGLLLWYGVPIAVIVTAGHYLPEPRLIGLVWSGAFGVMGGKCLTNALQCGRVHRYFTGPWLLLAALASLLYGFELIPHRWLTWDWIGNGALVGSLLLGCGSEILLGRYRHFRRTP